MTTIRPNQPRYLSPTRLEGMEIQLPAKQTVLEHRSPTRLEGMEMRGKDDVCKASTIVSDPP